MANIIVEGTKKDPYRVIVAIITITEDGTQKQTLAVEEGSPDAVTNARKVWALESAVYPAAKAALAELADAGGFGPKKGK